MKERLTVRVCEDPEKLFDDIISEVMQSADPKHSTGIAELTKKCLDGYKDMYMYSSGAVKHHHSGVGGLLYHSYRMVKSAAKISNIYPELDSELLVCAAALHDIGKIFTYDTNMTGGTTATRHEVLYGHPVFGAELIGEVYKHSHISVNMEKYHMLRHIVLSHHGELEYGAAVRPAIPEAAVVYCLDLLDSRVDMYNNAYAATANDEITEYSNSLGLRAFIPKNRMKTF